MRETKGKERENIKKGIKERKIKMREEKERRKKEDRIEEWM